MKVFSFQTLTEAIKFRTNLFSKEPSGKRAKLLHYETHYNADTGMRQSTVRVSDTFQRAFTLSQPAAPLTFDAVELPVGWLLMVPFKDSLCAQMLVPPVPFESAHSFAYYIAPHLLIRKPEKEHREFVQHVANMCVDEIIEKILTVTSFLGSENEKVV